MVQPTNKFSETPTGKFMAGSIAGTTEVLLYGQLFNYIKNCLITKESISWHPRMVYRGTITHISSISPMLAIQMGVNGIGTKIFKKEGERLSTLKKQVIAVSSGILSSLIGNPCELMILHQMLEEKKAKKLGLAGPSFFKIAKSIEKIHGKKAIFIGYKAMAFRESIFTLGYQWAANVFKDYLKEKGLSFSGIIGPAIVGANFSLISHPFTVIQVKQQENLKLETMSKTILQIFKEESWKGFFKGALPRTIRAACAVPLYITIFEEFQKRF